MVNIKEKVKKIPKSPGVYIMKDADGEILYIGKAKDLYKRVGSYFKANRPKTVKEMSLLEKVRSLDYIVTGSEEEALIYEAGLIKEKKPRYNIDLKDDKSFPFLKLTLNEKFPQLFITRKKLDDGAKYFGPYAHVKLLRSAVSIMKNIFPLRTCKKIPKEMCLAYHIGQCLGPCVGRINEKEYMDIVNQLALFLEGKKTELIEDLTKKMSEFSKAGEFEKAAIARDRISSLSEVSNTQMHDYSPWGNVAVKLKKILKLPWLPFRIEIFDVSNIYGKDSSGSMVYFYNGKPDKSKYRKFKIKEVKGIDDYAMIREIVRRRYKRLKEEGAKFPDLIIIDGGKAHLQCAYEELLKLNLSCIPIISIAKEEEKIYTVGSKTPVAIGRDSEIMHFIQHMRDEAHRFALSYHHKLREKMAIA